LKTVYEVVTVQRDFGNRTDRKLARLKYTLDNMGVPAFKTELEKRIGFTLEAPRQYTFTERKDVYGWQQGHNGLWHYTLFVENGRVLDEETVTLKSALLAIAKTNTCNFVFTANQNMMISDVAESNKYLIEEILSHFNVLQQTNSTSNIRKNAMACVALPTCPLALAEAQRYMPSFISAIEPLLEKYQLLEENIVIRMTGCPNGCARPYAAEIGFVGTAPGKYNLHIGGDNQGQRLNTLYKESLDEKAILNELNNLFALYKNAKISNERFGDFVIRTKLV
jgi:sulfite reductase (NADPH) hemoprotein beta-component